MTRRDHVIREAQRLVAKIKAEELRGTPVHAQAEHPWTLDDGGYPAEYAALVHALDALDDHDEEAPAA